MKEIRRAWVSSRKRVRHAHFVVRCRSRRKVRWHACLQKLCARRARAESRFHFRTGITSVVPCLVVSGTGRPAAGLSAAAGRPLLLLSSDVVR